MKGELAGKVALVTGGSRGIGRGIAQMFVSRGATVIITGRDKRRLDGAAEEMGVVGIVADSADGLQVERAVDRVVAEAGGIDVLVNNAGVFPGIGMMHEIEESEWDRIVDVNLTGVFRFARRVVPHMMKGGGGSIINISSDAGLKAFEGFNADAYSASKAGVVMLTRCWALEYARYKIRVNCICPGVVDTDMARPFMATQKDREMMNLEHPIGRVGTPADVAHAALYFASGNASWTTGAVLAVDGGESVK